MTRNTLVFVILGLSAWWFSAGSSVPGVVLENGDLEYPGYEIRSLEPYRMDARVLSREDYRFDRGSDLSPTDLALGWDSMADQRIVDSIQFSQRNRWYYWKVRTLPIPKHEIQSSSANVHIIPASEYVASQLSDVSTGDKLRLAGQLVQVNAADGWRWRSSLSRTDTGAGSCELLLLESLEWL